MKKIPFYISKEKLKELNDYIKKSDKALTPERKRQIDESLKRRVVFCKESNSFVFDE